MTENTQGARINAYKSLGHKGNQESLRQRRHEVTVELRKNKKEDQLFKRRNIHDNEPTSPLQESNGQTTPAITNLEELVNVMRTADPNKQFEAVQMARKMLSKEKNPPIDPLIGHGVVPLCVQFLDSYSNPKLQFEAAWALTNIASGTSQQTNAVVMAGAVPKFVDLIMSPEQNVAEQAVWALGNIAGDGPSARDFVLAHNIIENLLKLMQADIHISFLRNVVWMCSNLCRNKNPHPPFEKIRPLIPVLAKLLQSNDEQIVADSCWAMSYVTDDESEKIQCVVDSGAVPYLVNLLDSEVLSIVTPALRTVGNIVTGNDLQTDSVINADVVPRLIKLLTHKKSSIVKEAAWTISNIAAGNPDQVGVIINSEIPALLCHVLANSDFKTQKEAAWAVTNISTGGTPEQIIFLVEKYAILKPFCDLLESPDPRIAQVVLNGIENFFKLAEKINAVESICLLMEEIGAVDKIEALQNHDNEEIYKQAFGLVERYFSDGVNLILYPFQKPIIEAIVADKLHKSQMNQLSLTNKIQFD